MDTSETDRSVPVDFSRIKETSDGDLEFEQELFTIYLQDCDERMARLDEAVKTGNTDSLRREAHTIKGAGANVGTTRLHEIAAQMEGLEASTTPEDAAPLMEQLQAEYARVKAAVNTYLKTI